MTISFSSAKYFVHAAVDQLQFQFVEVDAFDFRNFEDALVIEHEIHGTGGAQRSARLIEITADIGYGAGRIVGSGFDDHGDAERSVAFVDHLLVVGSVFRYGAFDSPLDVLFLGMFAALAFWISTRRRVFPGSGPAALTAISIPCPAW